MIIAMLAQPELDQVELFEAGVEPDNVASRRCLTAAGFRVHASEPDCEGMLYYRADRRGEPGHGRMIKTPRRRRSRVVDDDEARRRAGRLAA